MLCSKALIFLTVVLWTSIGLYVGGGLSGLSGTLNLLEEYGPIKGRGNPALDDPPEMWVNPDTNQWEPINANKPGNRVPQAFHIVKVFLIVWASYMFLTSILLIVDSMRSQKAIQNRIYTGSRIGDSSISCTAWIVGYCVFLAIFWFIQAGFAVLPLVEFRITMQRCWDLNNPDFSPVSDQNVCVDLVQYGLVMFKETNDAGYALVCGPGGSYNPPRGNLEGFCENYYPTFVSFIICFVGAGIGVITLILFAIHNTSNFTYLKIRRYEGPSGETYIPSPQKSLSGPRSRSRKSEPRSHSSAAGVPAHMYDRESPSRTNGINLYNPNYETSMHPNERQPSKPVPEVMSFQRYHADEEDEAMEMRTMTSEKDREMTYYETGSDGERYPDKNHDRTPSPPPYNHESEEHGSGDYDRSRRHRRPKHHRRHRNQERKRSQSRSEKSGGRSRHTEASSDDNTSIGYTSSRPNQPNSGTHRTDRHRRQSDDESRMTRRSSDDEHLSRKSRGKVSSRGRDGSRNRLYEEDESPASDFYMDEDTNRRRPRTKY